MKGSLEIQLVRNLAEGEDAASCTGRRARLRLGREIGDEATQPVHCLGIERISIVGDMADGITRFGDIAARMGGAIGIDGQGVIEKIAADGVPVTRAMGTAGQGLCKQRGWD